MLKTIYLEKEESCNEAHKITQDIEHQYTYWIHAYLHRKEPDIINAYYRNSRAEKPMPSYDFDKERTELFDFISKPDLNE